MSLVYKLLIKNIFFVNFTQYLHLSFFTLSVCTYKVSFSYENPFGFLFFTTHSVLSKFILLRVLN